jgi:multidrug resistance protein, MATE family
MSSRLKKMFFSGSELRQLFALGVPVLIAQTSQQGMAFVDTVMTGQASAADLAAVGVATSVWAPFCMLGVGVLMPLTPLVAQSVGARQPQQAAHCVRQGLWLAALLSLLFMFFFYMVSQRLGLFGLEPELAALAGGYLRAIMWGFPGLLLFCCIRSLAEGHSCVRPSMVIGIVALALNIPCNYVLIYGKLGFPALGAVGCGVASAFCYWVMAVAMLCYVRREPLFSALRPLFLPMLRPLEGQKRIDGAMIRRVLRLGIPSAFAVFFEVSLFTLTALLLAPLGTVVVAGHQVALNFSSMIFMLPLALSMTIAIRTGYCLGAGKVQQAHLAARTALVAALCCAVCMALLSYTFRYQFVALYGDTPAVVELAVGLFAYMATYQLVDAVQAVSLGILRGYNDTRIISYVCFVTYWLIGLPLGYTLTYTTWLTAQPMGAQGFWTAYIVALSVGMCCYLWRVRWLHKLGKDAVQVRLAR